VLCGIMDFTRCFIYGFLMMLQVSSSVMQNSSDISLPPPQMPPRRSRSTASVEAPVDVLGTPEHVPASTDAESVDKLPIGFPTREPLPAFVPQVPVWWRGKNPKKANRLLRVTSVIAVVLIFGGLIVRYRDFFLVWEFSWDKTSTLALAAGAFLLAAGPILARRVNNKLARSALGASDKKFIDAKAQFDFEVVNGGFDRDEHALSKLLADASADELLDNLTYPKQLSDFPAALAALNAAAGHGAPVLPGPAAADSAVSVAVAAAAGASEGEGDDSDAAPVPRSRGRKAAAAPAAAAAAPRSRGRKSSAAATAAAAAAAAAAAESGDEAEEKDEHGSNATALVSVSPAAPAAAISDAEVAATPDATAADSASASVSSAAVALSAQLRRLIRASQPAYAVRSDEPQPTEPLPSGRAVPVAGRVHPSKPGSSFPREAATLLLSSAAAQRKQSLKPALSEMDAELVLNLAAQAGALPEDCSALQLARLWDTALRPPRVLVFEWDGDLLATETPLLASFVDFAVKTCAPGKDEVVLLLESGGGAVPHYGRAAYELARLRQHGVHLTVCVDKVAASGGYMMAAVADRIVAAPFAYVGSVYFPCFPFTALSRGHHILTPRNASLSVSFPPDSQFCRRDRANSEHLQGPQEERRRHASVHRRPLQAHSHHAR
jgi:hypothetical protein